MVSQPAETIVTSPVKASECIRIEVCDPRSDNRRRVVEVGRDAVLIRRAVAGVSMAIRIEARDYRGVALRITGLDDGGFHYEVRLAHRDPDLSVPLDASDDLATIEARWRAWVAFLRLPALAGRSETVDAPVSVEGVELARRTPHARRRGDALASRRPRFSKRRTACGALTPAIVDLDPTVLFDGWRGNC